MGVNLMEISKWDVSNVEDMDYMFYRCKKFNSNLNNWDVSKVKKMYSMFDNTPLKKYPPKWYKE